MKNKINSFLKNKAISLGAIFCGLVLPLTLAYADNDSRSFKKLGGQWWEWVLSFPASEYPVADKTGERCMVGQKGDIWFLVGTDKADGTVTKRNCSVPEGVSLFFPVINFFSLDTPGACGQPADQPRSVKDLRADALPFIDGATNLVAELDGKPIRFRRAASEPFSVAFAKDNLFADACAGEAGGLPITIYSPGVADGYWALIRSIKDDDGDDNIPSTFETDHVLHIQAESTNDPKFKLDVTYNLDVVPVRDK